jgi:hypothetical protein
MAKRARKKQAGSAAAKSRGGHGGARGGAGRPPLLSWEQVTWFCALLENEWNRLARAEAKRRGLAAELSRAKRREPYLTEDEIEKLGKQNLYVVPLSERRERAAQTDELGEGDHTIDEKIANTREFIRITEPDDRLAKLPPEDGPDTAKELRGYRTYPGRRPKGRREALIRETIVAIEKRYRVKVSPDYVKLQWKKYRRDVGLTHRRPDF